MLAFDGSAGIEVPRDAPVRLCEISRPDQGQKAGADAGTTLLDRASLSGREESYRHGAISSPTMALLASPHGLGDDGHAVHASGATRAQRHPFITELLRHPDLARNHLTGPAHEPGRGVETDAPS